MTETAIPEVLPKRGAGRPQNFLKLVGDKPLAERVAAIVQYHESAATAYAQSAFYAVMCGFELHAARAQIPHGGWEAWIETHCPFSKQSAWLYMKAAERKQKEIPNLQRVRDFVLGVAPHDLKESSRKLLLAAVQDATDGETYRQLLLGYGLIKEPKPVGGHHPRQGEEPTPAEKAEGRKIAALADWKDIERRLAQWVHKKQYAHVEDVVIRTARQTLQAALALIPEV